MREEVDEKNPFAAVITNIVYLGSMLGNSQLIKLMEKPDEQVNNHSFIGFI